MAAPAPITNQVTGVTPETQYTPTATPIPGKRVTFTTSTGYEDTVFIPDTVFGDPAAIRQVIEGVITQVAAAQAITGTLPGA